MKGKLATLATAASLVFAFSSAPASAHHVALLGNNLPHVTGGDKYMLHLHAYDHCKEQEFEDSNRRVIMLKANFGDFNGPGNRHPDALKENDIFLQEGDFAVIDGNACANAEDDGALFQLPSDIATSWTAYWRLRGEPGTGVDIAFCFFDTALDDIVCPAAEVGVRDTGKPQTRNVTNTLLKNIDWTDLDADPFWEVFTQGRAKATLYFYPDSALP